ncbi:CYTH domain-containing protein [Pasteurellaceae bacterium HPA106]|uniref:CYTH domain-containing protein n=1 Tax=Spirabiliibacterium pneumoniae TaxID=221400 RepID=UPI001AAE17AE|nr:CYTH domain-containing protein [Spirabiliibacterium pneumoniae]MBE2896122.1 CYTH domain-containing protein [Spirabiliibacterium pneumoniae]
MLPEVEVKLLVKQNVATFLSQAMSDYRLLSHTQAVLGNCYYDSDDRFFSRHKMGLRVRTINQSFELTLKLSGHVTGGLHQRPEYNVPLASPKPDLSRFAQFPELQFDTPLTVLQASLKAIFSTDFLRQTWTVELGTGSVIEVALDQGEIISGEHRAPISEIEFELKQGSVTDLLTFVSHITAMDGARFGQLSKAERGYQLSGIAPSQPLPPLQLPKVLDETHLDRLLAHELSLIELILRGDSDLRELTALYQFWQAQQSAMAAIIQKKSKVRLLDLNEHFFDLNVRLLRKFEAIENMQEEAQRAALDNVFYSNICTRRHLFLIQLSIG